MGVVASGSKVILDLTDSGRLFVNVTANHLRTQIRETNSNGSITLTPDWKTTPLKLTPVVYFDQQVLPIASSGLTINWTKRIQQANGAQTASSLGSTEKVDPSEKTLTVSDNTLSSSANGMISYSVKATYVVANVTYTDTAEIDFSLVSDGEDGAPGEKGDRGASIASVTNYYLASASASGVTTSTTGWKTAVQTTSASKPYLWNYEVIKDSDGKTINTTTPCIIGHFGKDGLNGRGISSIVEHYKATDSTTAPESGWSETLVTTDPVNKYLWNYETINYTDGNSEDSTKRIIGTYGDKGDKGAKGENGDPGRSVVSTRTQYHVHTSKNDPPSPGSAGWVDEMPPWQRGVYLWTRIVSTYSDGNVEPGTPMCDPTWETVLDAVSDMDNLSGKWARSDNGCTKKILTSPNILAGYGIDVYLRADIPILQQTGEGMPSSSNIRPFAPRSERFIIHQTGCTVLPDLGKISVKKTAPKLVVLPYAVPAESYTLKATFGSGSGTTTVELCTLDDSGNKVSLDDRPSVDNGTPTKAVNISDAIRAVYVSTTSTSARTVNNIRLIPIGCTDDGEAPVHKEHEITIPEVVGAGSLNTGDGRIYASWVYVPDLYNYSLISSNAEYWMTESLIVPFLENIAAENGSKAVFRATGRYIESWQWQVNKNDGKGWIDIPNTYFVQSQYESYRDSALPVISTEETRKYTFRCSVVGKDGKTGQTNTAKITLPPSQAISYGPGGEVIEEEVVEEETDIEIGGQVYGVREMIGVHAPYFQAQKFDREWGSDISDAVTPMENGEKWSSLDGGETYAGYDHTNYPVKCSHLQPLSVSEWVSVGDWGQNPPSYFPEQSRQDCIILDEGKHASTSGAAWWFSLQPDRSSGDLVDVDGEYHNARIETDIYIIRQHRKNTPLQILFRTESPVEFRIDTPRLTSVKGCNNVWIEGSTNSVRIAGVSDVTSLTDAVEALQRESEANRESWLNLTDGANGETLATLGAKIASADGSTWMAGMLGVDPKSVEATIKGYTERLGVIEKGMLFDTEGLKLHASSTPYYTLIAEDGMQIRKGYAKQDDSSFIDQDTGLPANAYFDPKGEYIVTGDGEAAYTVKASFRADGAYLPRAHVTDVLSLGRKNFGWFGIQVVGGGLGFVWRDGLSGYIIAQPMDYQVSAAGNAVRFRVIAANIVSYQWQVSTSYNAQNFPVWANVNAPTAKNPELIYTPSDSCLNGGARWRCVLTDQTNSRLYTTMCVATVAGA